jgi:hypothetical protein
MFRNRRIPAGTFSNPMMDGRTQKTRRGIKNLRQSQTACLLCIARKLTQGDFGSARIAKPFEFGAGVSKLDVSDDVVRKSAAPMMDSTDVQNLVSASDPGRPPRTGARPTGRHLLFRRAVRKRRRYTDRSNEHADALGSLRPPQDPSGAPCRYLAEGDLSLSDP